MDEKAVMGPLTLELHFCGGQACTQLLSCTVLQPLQGVSKQPAPALSAGLSSQPCFPARAFTRRCTSGWAHRAVARTTCLSCLPLPTMPSCEPLKLLLCPSLTMQAALRFCVPERLVPAALGDELTGFGGECCLSCVSCGHKRLCSLKKC